MNSNYKNITYLVNIQCNSNKYICHYLTKWDSQYQYIEQDF